MPICDTSWLIALLDEDDDHHPSADEQAASGSALLVPAPVLAETLHVLWHRIRRDHGPVHAHRACRAALDGLERTPTWRVLPEADHGSARDVYDAHPRLSYVDAVGVAASRRTGEPLWTFDAAQQDALAYSSSVAGAT